MNRINFGKFLAYLFLLIIIGIVGLAAFWPTIGGTVRHTVDRPTGLLLAGDESSLQTTPQRPLRPRTSLQAPPQRPGIILVANRKEVLEEAWRLYHYGLQDLAQEPSPGQRFAAGMMWTVGTMLAASVLMAVYFNIGIVGRVNPSAVHGITGIAVGLALLLFTTAYLYYDGYVFWFSFLGGAIVSLVLTALLSYLRIRWQGDAGGGGMHTAFHWRSIRRK